MAKIIPTETSLYFSRQDPQDIRFGDLVLKPLNSESSTNQSSPLAPLEQGPVPGKNSLHIWGYASDLGIKKNSGRPGAALAPPQIRKYFYKLTPQIKDQLQIIDHGDCQEQPTHKTNEADLNEVHAMAFTFWENLNNEDFLSQATPSKNFSKLDSSAIKKSETSSLSVSFGGGHDFGYVDGKAFLEIHPTGVVINIDAHLDVRKPNPYNHSGTPFYRLLTENSFPFLELGINPLCSSPDHSQFVQSLGHSVIHQNFSTPELVIQQLNEWLQKNHSLAGRPLFLSIDMDALSSTLAPGCSQSWANGLSLTILNQCLQKINQHFDLKHIGIYEVSPPLDVDDRTSKLAAEILFTLLQQRGLC